jgi:hypothetical protein
MENLAAVPENEFEAALADRTTKPTTNGIIRTNMAPNRNRVSTEALDPSEVLSTMTSSMPDDIPTLAPRVAAWLQKIGKLKETS